MEKLLKIFFVVVLLTSFSFICMVNKKNIVNALGLSEKKDNRKKIADMAALSDVVYSFDNESFKLPPGYKMEKSITGDNGFQAAAFRNTTTGQIIISYRGTDDLKDAVSDIQLGLDTKNSNYDSQIKQSFDFYNSVTQEFGKDKVSLTGHSLGGNLAQIVGAKNQVETNTFNAPGVTESSIEKWVGTIRQSLPIINHIRQNDSVGNYGKHIGETKAYADRPIPNDDITLVTPDYFIENHGIKKFLEDFQNNPSFEGKFVTDQELQAARANRAVPDTEFTDKLLHGVENSKKSGNQNMCIDSGDIVKSNTHSDSKSAKENGEMPVTVSGEGDEAANAEPEAIDKKLKEIADAARKRAEERETAAKKEEEEIDKKVAEVAAAARERAAQREQANSSEETDKELEELIDERFEESRSVEEELLREDSGMYGYTDDANTEAEYTEIDEYIDQLYNSNPEDAEIDDYVNNIQDEYAEYSSSYDEMAEYAENLSSGVNNDYSNRHYDNYLASMEDIRSEHMHDNSFQSSMNSIGNRYKEYLELAAQREAENQRRMALLQEEEDEYEDDYDDDYEYESSEGSGVAIGNFIFKMGAAFLGGYNQAQEENQARKNAYKKAQYRAAQAAATKAAEEKIRRRNERNEKQNAAYEAMVAENNARMKELEEERMRQQEIERERKRQEAEELRQRRREAEERRQRYLAQLEEQKRASENRNSFAASTTNTTSQRRSIDTSGFYSSSPWKPPSSSISSGSYGPENYSNNYYTQEELDSAAEYWVTHPEEAERRRQEDAYRRSSGDPYVK